MHPPVRRPVAEPLRPPVAEPINWPVLPPVAEPNFRPIRPTVRQTLLLTVLQTFRQTVAPTVRQTLRQTMPSTVLQNLRQSVLPTVLQAVRQTLRQTVLLSILPAVFLTVLQSFVFCTPAQAIDRYVHGGFAANSSSCARCHVTHSADAAFLINDSRDRTRFCLSCHGYMSVMSQYDVYSGLTRGTDSVSRPSPAGGFSTSPDPYSDWTNGSTAVLNANTSAHHVWSLDGGLDTGQRGGDIPGGTDGLTGDFACTSCHDPHAGGKYPPDPGEPYRNPRLLKKRPLDSAVDLFVYMKIDYDYGAGYAWSATPEGGGHSSQTIEYGRGFDAWCGSCHDVFNTEGPTRTGSVGITNALGETRYRHKMGVLLTSTTHPGFTTSIQNGLPLPTTTNGDRDAATSSTGRLNCITCHRAHGSSVPVSVGYRRYQPYTTIYRDGSGNLVPKDTIAPTDLGASALLRLKERDVCYICHGAAEYNKFTSSDNYGQGY